MKKTNFNRAERKHIFRNKNVSNDEVTKIANDIKNSLHKNLVEQYKTSKIENRFKEITTLVLVAVIIAVCFLSECK